jgi:hypothetical protein
MICADCRVQSDCSQISKTSPKANAKYYYSNSKSCTGTSTGSTGTGTSTSTGPVVLLVLLSDVGHLLQCDM